MFGSILVPLDGTSSGESSLPLAGVVAAASGVSVQLAYVHEPYKSDGLLSSSSFRREDVDQSQDEGGARVDGLEYLDDVQRRVTSNGVDAGATLLVEGNVLDQLLDHAHHVEAGAIFISSRVREGSEYMTLGSLADQLLRQSPLPLVIVHPDRGKRDFVSLTRIDHIIVALDWSSLTGLVFGSAIDLAKTMRARVTLVTVITPVVSGPRIMPAESEGSDGGEAQARQYLAQVADGLRAEGLSVDVLVVSADEPVRGIVSVANACGATLIAMATHGYRRLRGVRIRSITAGVLHHGRLPVLLCTR